MRSVTHHHQHHQGADNAGNHQRAEVIKDLVIVFHHAHADRHKQQHHIADQQMTAGFDPPGRHNLRGEQGEQQQHADNAAGNGDRQQRRDCIAGE
ncbi:hypothetical protein D3C75_1172260 [compost metagenome]